MIDGNDTLIKLWTKRSEKHRKKLAALSNDINLEQISSCLPHDIHTAENTDAYTEKLNKYKRTPLNPEPDWNEEVEQLNKERLRRDVGKKRKRPEEMEVGGMTMTREETRTLMVEIPRLSVGT